MWMLGSIRPSMLIWYPSFVQVLLHCHGNATDIGSTAKLSVLKLSGLCVWKFADIRFIWVCLKVGDFQDTKCPKTTISLRNMISKCRFTEILESLIFRLSGATLLLHFVRSENFGSRMMMGPYYELGKVLGIEAKTQWSSCCRPGSSRVKIWKASEWFGFGYNIINIHSAPVNLGFWAFNFDPHPKYHCFCCIMGANHAR